MSPPTTQLPHAPSLPAPPQPAYILRGHAAPVHAVTFLRRNSRLATGDSDGWVVLWCLATKRARAVWKAHEGAVLGLEEWGDGRIITHGKDDKLIVWKLAEEDEEGMSTILPVEDATSQRKHPWLLHMLSVNTLNFCAFGDCAAEGLELADASTDLAKLGEYGEMLFAVPNTMTSEAVDIFHLPSEKRIYTVPGDKSANTGMVMAVSIFYQSGDLVVVVGYESGHTIVSQMIRGLGWQIIYLSKAHAQPVLSLDVAPDHSFYFTSSADAIIAKHPIPIVQRPNQVPCAPSSDIPTQAAEQSGSGLSTLFKSAQPSTQSQEPTPIKPIEVQTMPIKVHKTGHSGQQSLRIRSDGRIYATAGWDARVRIYSVQSMKELAVLKWHKEGCYAAAFASIIAGGNDGVDVGMACKERRIVPRLTTLSVKEKRVAKAAAAHWIAAGSKDGKVSLWDIY